MLYSASLQQHNVNNKIEGLIKLIVIFQIQYNQK